MKRTCDVIVHLFNFKQLDVFFEGTFKMRFSVEGKINELPLIAGPYLLPKNSKSTLKAKYFITRPFTPGIHNNKLLNDMCTFRVEIPYIEDLIADEEENLEMRPEVFIKVDLMMYGLESTKFAETYPPDKDGFSVVSTNMLKLRKIWNGIHEYTEVNFHEVIFCTASLAIHAELSDFVFDIRFLHSKLKSKPGNSSQDPEPLGLHFLQNGQRQFGEIEHFLQKFRDADKNAFGRVSPIFGFLLGRVLQKPKNADEENKFDRVGRGEKAKTRVDAIRGNPIRALFEAEKENDRIEGIQAKNSRIF